MGDQAAAAAVAASCNGYAYVAVKASLHAADSAVFGLNDEEANALSKRFGDNRKEVINGIVLQATPIQVVNALSQLDYRVICSTGETEITWTLERDL